MINVQICRGKQPDTVYNTNVSIYCNIKVITAMQSKLLLIAIFTIVPTNVMYVLVIIVRTEQIWLLDRDELELKRNELVETLYTT